MILTQQTIHFKSDSILISGVYIPEPAYVVAVKQCVNASGKPQLFVVSRGLLRWIIAGLSGSSSISEFTRDTLAPLRGCPSTRVLWLEFVKEKVLGLCLWLT
jgi:hypothetical protein